LAGRTMATLGPTLRALAAYEQFLCARPSIVAGDFNNHIRWDRTGKAWNHANTLSTFERLGFVSAYHVFQGLPQGPNATRLSTGGCGRLTARRTTSITPFSRGPASATCSPSRSARALLDRYRS